MTAELHWTLPHFMYTQQCKLYGSIPQSYMYIRNTCSSLSIAYWSLQVDSEQLRKFEFWNIFPRVFRKNGLGIVPSMWENVPVLKTLKKWLPLYWDEVFTVSPRSPQGNEIFFSLLVSLGSLWTSNFITVSSVNSVIKLVAAQNGNTKQISCNAYSYSAFFVGARKMPGNSTRRGNLWRLATSRLLERRMGRNSALRVQVRKWCKPSQVLVVPGKP